MLFCLSLEDVSFNRRGEGPAMPTQTMTVGGMSLHKLDVERDAKGSSNFEESCKSLSTFINLTAVHFLEEYNEGRHSWYLLCYIYINLRQLGHHSHPRYHYDIFIRCRKNTHQPNR